LYDDVLDSLPATFTPADVESRGLSRRATYLWRDQGSVVQLARGVYRKAQAPEPSHLDLLVVSKRAPRAIACLVSALVVHDLTDEIPTAVQMAVPRGVHPPHISYPPVEFSRFDPRTFGLGRELLEAAPAEFVPVYSAERAVVDCMRLRHRVGDTVALRALRRYLSAHPGGAGDLLDLAHRIGDASALRRAIQVVQS
jgi:predicted transcriptional regulator of viral defense system